jgi:hypothetical protein
MCKTILANICKYAILRCYFFHFSPGFNNLGVRLGKSCSELLIKKPSGLRIFPKTQLLTKVRFCCLIGVVSQPHLPAARSRERSAVWLLPPHGLLAISFCELFSRVVCRNHTKRREDCQGGKGVLLTLLPDAPLPSGLVIFDNPLPSADVSRSFLRYLVLRSPASQRV